MSLFAVDLNEVMIYALKAGAAVVGFLVGYFVAGPVANFLSRVAFHRPVAPTLLILIRLGVGVGLGILLFFLVKVGPGRGGDNGDGKDKGKDSGKEGGGRVKGGKYDPAIEKDKDAGKGKDSAPEKDKKIEAIPSDLIQVEIVKERKPDDQRFFLFQRGEPPLTIEELEGRVKKFMKEIKAKNPELKVARLQLVITKDSYGFWEDPEFRRQIDDMAGRNDLLMMKAERLDLKLK